MKTYRIAEDYTHRTQPPRYYDDTGEEDHWQKEVYIFAERVAMAENHHTICDFGTGSAFKLLKHFGDSRYQTLGIDLPQTISVLAERYPQRLWKQDLSPLPRGTVDLFIASDVIEHMEDPDILLDFIEQCGPKDIILSTPDRNLMSPKRKVGPPTNPGHVREWTFEEFADYIGGRFEIIHQEVTHRRQKTQMIHARCRGV